MKITVDIDCTPEEARAFLGLPDVRPMQAAVMEAVQERLLAGVAATEPEQLMRAWMQTTMPAALSGAAAGGLQGWEQLQKAFWSQMSDLAAGGTPGKGHGRDGD